MQRTTTTGNCHTYGLSLSAYPIALGDSLLRLWLDPIPTAQVPRCKSAPSYLQAVTLQIIMTRSLGRRAPRAVRAGRATSRLTDKVTPQFLLSEA
jgi:hypothetical protein